MPVVYLGIGSNLGSRQDNCMKAISMIEDSGLTVTRISSMYETEPWGSADQPMFINMAIAAETSFTPVELLALLKEIETKMGRQPAAKWGPRIIDLDILLYDDIIMNNNRLTIPHPLMHKRDFVLKPLSEIAPEKVHPVLLKKIGDLLVQDTI
jgi:2-amino-4-hydroxy-6-hydroxymethyldihydropteridine diphosphokinase